MDGERLPADASSARLTDQTPSDAPVLVVVDRASNILAAEGEGLAELGLTRELLVGRAAADALDDRPDLHRYLARALANEEGKLMAETLHGRIELSYHPTRSEDGQVLGATLETPLPRARAPVDQQGREERRILRMIFRQVPGAVWTVDHDLRVTHAAGRLQKRSGVAHRAVVGATIPELFGTDDPAHPAIAHHRAALAGESTSLRYPLNDRCYQVQLEPLRDQQDRKSVV